MRRKERKILEFQIVVFLEWARKHNRPSSEYRPYLFEFCDFTPKEDIWEVTDEDVDEYIYVNTDTIKTKYQEHVCRKALNGLRKYYSSRARNGVAKEHAGRPKNIGDRLLVHKYRKMRDEKGKPLSFRVISKIMDKSSALVHRWSKEPVDRWEE